MKGDFSRNTFDPVRHFSQVLMQQGRVQLDADWNEQSAILLHYLRTLASDLIGAHAGPEGESFLVKPNADLHYDFGIGNGRYYVDGILCENEGRLVDGAWLPLSYREQPLFPGRGQLSNGRYLVYLDVWERHVTAIEDGRIRESALGGPDTATRAQVVWQVNVDSNLSTTLENDLVNRVSDSAAWRAKVDEWQPQNRSMLKARVNPNTEAYTDPCITKPDAGYRGGENQLYRVEIHSKGEGSDAPTFKWSRENGSVCTAWLGREGHDLIVETMRGFEAEGIWVELTHDSLDLRHVVGPLVRLASAADGRLVVDAETIGNVPGWNPAWKNPKIRRWDQRALEQTPLQDGAVPITTADWIELDAGIEVRFAPDTTYRPGDYWIIPARVGGGIEWPVHDRVPNRPLDPVAKPPDGVLHHYAPLAIISVVGEVVTNEYDLRCHIQPLTRCDKPAKPYPPPPER